MKKFLPLIIVVLLGGAGSSVFGQADSVCNAGFEDSLSTWIHFANTPSVATFDPETVNVQDGNVSAKIDVSASGGLVVINSCLGDLEGGLTYRVSFWVKSASGSLSMKAETAKATAPYTNYGELNCTATSTWQKFTYTAYTDTNVTADVRIAKFKFNDIGTYYLDNITIDVFDAWPEICEGNFESGVAGWGKTVSAPSSSITNETSDVFQGSISARVEAPDLSSGQVILSSCKSDFEGGKNYLIKFWAKTTGSSMDIEASSALGAAPWTIFGSQTYTINNTWNEYEYEASSDSTIKGNIAIFKLKPQSTGTVLVDSVTVEEIPPQARICGGDMEAGLTDWAASINNGAVAQIVESTEEARSDTQSVKVEVITPGSVQSSVQLSSCKSDIFAGETYTVSFWAKAIDGDVDVKAFSSLSEAPFTNFASADFTIAAGEWYQYCFNFTADTTLEGNVRLLKLQFPNAGKLYIDDADVTDSLVECFTAGIQDRWDVSSNIRLYPNPANNVLNVQSLDKHGFKNGNWMVRDLTGKVVARGNNVTSGSQIQLNITDFEKGIYLFEWHHQDGFRNSASTFIKN